MSATRYIYFAAAGWALLLAQLVGVIRYRAAVVCTVAVLVVISAVFLRLNLRPWRTAGEVMNAMSAGLQKGEPAELTVARWQASRGVELELKNGIPYQYQGVGIFINGYPEFRRIAERGR